MPRAKTKKIIKPQRRLASKKKRVIKKRAAAKKVFKKEIALIKAEPKLETKKTLPETNPAVAPKQPALNLVKKQNSRISPHVLDLKKLQTQKMQTEHSQKKHAQMLSQEIYNIIERPHKILAKNIQSLYKSLSRQDKHSSAAPVLEHSSKNSDKTRPKKLLRLKLPKINLPQLNWPQIDFRFPKLLPDEIHLGRLIVPPSWKKAIFSFLIFCLIIILPFGLYDYYQQLQGKKNEILHKLVQAAIHLTTSQKAASASDLYNTQFELTAAGQDFNQAKQELDSVSLISKELLKLIPSANKKYETAEKLVDIGARLSNGAAVLTQALAQINLSQNDQGSLNSLNLNDKLILLKDKLNLILPDLKYAKTELNSLEQDQIPTEYQDKIKILQTTVPLLEENISNFVSSSDLILKILGQDSKKRYLLLFQNNNELRPTGGFIGSYAMIDIDRGNIKKIDIPGGGPYDLKAGLTVNLEPPYPLRPLNTRWEFQDANWFPDLPTSADKLIWLYEKSGGPTVDGLIFVNATFLQKILQVMGPVELSNYGLTIDANNFFDKVQENTEINYDKTENKPKQIIADLAPQVINGLLHLDKEQFPEILDLIFNSLTTKEIQFYFTDYSIEKMVLANNWGGQLKDTDKDYLAIFSSNIGAEKTDAKINYQADLAVDIQPDGSLINTLNLTKIHEGNPGELFYGAANLDYLRIYVPRNSELISASGFEKMPEENMAGEAGNFQADADLRALEMTRKTEPDSQTEIYQDGDKTFFANWVKVEPSQKQTITLKYKLPFKLNLNGPGDNSNLLTNLKKSFNLDNNIENTDVYSLLWQKQSGIRNFNLTLKINFPDNFIYPFIYPTNLAQQNNEFSIQDDLNKDKFFAIIFRPY